jgi:hypothetical protein
MAMAQMVNKAGVTLRPTVASIQSAMEDFQAVLQNGTGLYPHLMSQSAVAPLVGSAVLT